MPGYILLDEENESLPLKYLCSYCGLLLRDAMQTTCGHFYCSSCIEKLFQGEHLICLVDKQIIPPNEFFPDNFVRREVLGVVVSCVNAEHGCKWRGEVRHLENHTRVCEFQRLPCIHQDCGRIVLKGDLPRHLMTDCKHRLQQCVYCGKEVSVASMEAHHNTECPMFPAACAKCKKEGIPRDMMSVHQNPLWGECAEVEGPCPFSRLGCPSKEVMKKEDRAQHLKDTIENHLSLLLKDYLDLKELGGAQSVAAAAHNPLVSYGTDQEDRITRDTLVKVNALVQDNITLRRKIAEQSSQLQDLEFRLVNLSAGTAGQVTSPQPRSYKSADSDLGHSIRELRNRVTNVENTSAEYQVYYIENVRRINEQEEQVTQLKRQVETSSDSQRRLEGRVDAQDNMAGLRNLALADLEEMVRDQDVVTFDGAFLWKINEVARRRNDATAGRRASIYSPAFYSSRYGYKMCARIYLNGDGLGKGTHFSLFFVLMRGENDALLRWPFRQKVTLMLLDQDNVEHLIDAFRPDPASSSFQKPKSEMNIASGCPMFCPLTELDKHAYIRDDNMFIKVIVDTAEVP